MLKLHIEKVGEIALIECEGRIVLDDAFRLREAVTSQYESRIIVVEFSEVSMIDAGGLSMLVFLQRWAYEHNIRLKLFNLSSFVEDQVKRVNSMQEFDIATIDEMMALIAQADRLAKAA